MSSAEVEAPAAPTALTTTRWGDPPDGPFLEQVSSLFDRTDGHKPLELLRWQYLQGPAGPATAAAIARGRRFGALYTTVPRRLWIRGRSLKAAQSLDVRTADEWRGRGLYIRLAEQVYERLDAEGVDVVFGFPNDEAAPAFFGRLGWESLGNVPLLARPLPTGVGRRLLGVPSRQGRSLPLTIAELSELPTGTDELWRRVSPMFPVAVARDAAYLQWRLFERPGSDYTLMAVHDRGRLVSMGGVSIGERAGRRVAHLLELMVDPASPGSGRRLLGELLSVAARRRAEVVLAWSPVRSPTHGLLRRSGFARVPRHLVPKGVNVGVRLVDRRRTGLLACLDPTNWYLSYLDSDTV